VQFELIGCTGAGKSTLVSGILQACQGQGIKALTSDDFVLTKARLNWVNVYWVRTLLIDFFTLATCLLNWRKNRDIYLAMLRNVVQLPPPATWFEKLNIIRNTLKKIGGHEFIRRYDSDQQVVLIDEGTLHTAQYLFVRNSVEAMIYQVPTFIRLLPLPDVIIYLRQNERILVERTLARGHKRIPDGSRADTERFIKSSAAIFDKLVENPSIKNRLFVVDRDQSIFPAPNYENVPCLAMTLRILRAGLDVVNSNIGSRNFVHARN